MSAADAVDQSDPIPLAERLAGAVWGHLVGDAAGVPYEFGPPLPAAEVVFGRTPGTHHQPVGTWSDDGALMLATLDSLTRPRGPREPAFDPADLGGRLCAWLEEGRYTPDGDGPFDVGQITAEALHRLARSLRGDAVPPSSIDPDRLAGNGSLMRILPVALVSRGLPTAELVRRSQAASALTHPHPLAAVACALYCLIAGRFLSGPIEPAVALAAAAGDLRRHYREADDPAGLAALSTLLAYRERSGSGYAVDSFWSAWDAVAGAGDYAEAVRRAIAYGDDTDTTAAIAGGLAGLRFGLASIPSEWLGRMRDPGSVDAIIERLLAAV